MAIGPVELNGAMTRLQDFTSMKHNEDTKGLVDQTNFQTQFHQEIDSRLNQVHKSDNAENGETKYDAKDKGKNSYEGDGGKKKKNDFSKEEGKVVRKGYSGFDMKI